MKLANAVELRAVDGGASKYVKCQYCGYNYKTTFLERLFWSNTKVKYYFSTVHFSAMGGYKRGQSAHKR